MDEFGNAFTVSDFHVPAADEGVFVFGVFRVHGELPDGEGGGIVLVFHEVAAWGLEGGGVGVEDFMPLLG